MATTYPGAGDPDGDRRRLALMLARGGLDASPVRHWTQGAARAANAALAGLLMAEDGDRREVASRRTAEALARLLGGGAKDARERAGADPAAAVAIVADPRADPSAKQIAAGVLQRALARVPGE